MFNGNPYLPQLQNMQAQLAQLQNNIPQPQVQQSVQIQFVRAVVGSYDKYLYVVRSNGELIRKIFIGGKIFSSPIILDDGTIFCATTNGKAVFVEY